MGEFMQGSSESSGKELIVHPRGSLRGPTKLLYLEPMEPNSSEDHSSRLLVEYWQIIGNKLPLIIAMAVLGSVAGALVSFRQTPIYQARLSLEIQNPSDTALNRIGDLEAAERGIISPESYLPTQAKILQSRTLRQRAYARVKEKNFSEGFRTPDRLAAWRAVLGISTPKLPAQPVSTMPPIELKVRVAENTRVVEILCDSTDPRVAAAFANTLANEYIDSNLEARWDAINRAREWLTRQLEEVRIKLQKSEGQLQNYGRTFGLIFTSEKDSVEQEKLKQIQAELSKAQAERIAKQSTYQIAATSTANSVPQVIDNTRLSDYQVQLAGLRRQLAELSSQFTPEHYKVKRIQAQINELETTFRKERDNILTRIRNEYESALMREKLLNGAYRKQTQLVSEEAGRAISYNILKREVDTNRQLYDSLLQKTKEAGIASAMRASNVRIIDLAEPPRLPYKPNLLWNTLLGSLMGLIVGLITVLVRESLDRSLRAPGEVSFHLRLPELGVIPTGDLASGKGYDWSGNGRVELITWRDKTSYIAESFRGALTSVLHSAQNGACPKVILISSAMRGEGKSTAVANLGIALAEIDRRVLLIDADMRKPRLHEVFNVPNTWGLSDLLREKSSVRESPLEALARRTEVVGLYILVSGPGTTSVTNLLYSSRMSELLQRFRSEFDAVLIDAPPMLDISDARILGRLADAAILVIHAGKTNRDAAMAAKRRLNDDGIPILGTILNAWDVKSKSRYGYAGGSYS